MAQAETNKNMEGEPYNKRDITILNQSNGAVNPRSGDVEEARGQLKKQGW